MVRRSFIFPVVGIVTFLLLSTASADVPHMISYQGKLTTASGGCLNETVQMIFSIYPDTLGSPAEWSETHAQVVVQEGIFNVLLGAVDTIPQAVFDGNVKYLGVQVESDPEMRPLKPMVSVAYAYRAATVDGGGAGNGWVDDGGVVRLETITDSVGIGTTTPSAKLEVVGDLVVSGKATIGPNHTNTGGSAFVAGQDNTASSAYVTVSGGFYNRATNSSATIGGGTDNLAQGASSTIAGGEGNSASGIKSTVGGGENNTASGQYAAVSGGSSNVVGGNYSAILGGFADTLLADYSYLFGIGSKLTQDSTFMVDLPHIRFGGETDGYEFPTDDGAAGQVMQTDGGGQLSWVDMSGGAGEGWADDGTVVRLDASTDSVGIGTATPSEKLEVSGNIKASGTLTSGSSITIDGSSDQITATGGTIDFDDENLVTTGKATIGPNHTNTGEYAFVAGVANTASGDRSAVGGGGGNSTTGEYATVGGGNANEAYRYSTVAGGYSNAVTNMYGTIGGGYNNQADGSRATIAGGEDNYAAQYGATIGGGRQNAVAGYYSTIPGGFADTLLADYSYLFGIGSKLTQDSTFMVDLPHIRFGGETDGYEFPTDDGAAGQVMQTDGDGQLSWVDMSGGAGGGWTDDGTVVRLDASTDFVGIGTATPSEKLEVSGNIKASGTLTSGSSITIDGSSDQITATGGTIDFDDENLVTTGKATIGPGHVNTGSNAFVAGSNNSAISPNATVGGGKYNAASGWYAAVGGGSYNKARGDFSVVAGGGGDAEYDSNLASGGYSTVSGGRQNAATDGATVGGGEHNLATNTWTTIGGGFWNRADGFLSTVGGGKQNKAYGYNSTIAGGSMNYIDSSSSCAAIGGGYSNEAIGDHPTVGGGDNNCANGFSATVAGGFNNNAGDTCSTVGGGWFNYAGRWGTVPGGRENWAYGDYSFAAGHKAQTTHNGTFIWADQTDAVFASTGEDQFLVRASGGVGIGTTSPQGALDVSSTTGAFIVPRMTTTQRDALTPVNGMIIYNTSTNQFNFYENGAWVTK